MQRLKKHLQDSSVNRSTGTPTICSTTRSDTRILQHHHHHFNNLFLDVRLGDRQRSGAQCAPVMATIKCTMRTCKTLQHKLPRKGVERKVMDNNNTSVGTRRHFWRIRLIVQHVSNREQ